MIKYEINISIIDSGTGFKTVHQQRIRFMAQAFIKKTNELNLYCIADHIGLVNLNDMGPYL